MHRADAQAILDVGKVAPAVEEAQEVLALGPLHAADRGLVGEELARLRVRQEKLVKGVHESVGVLLGEGAERPQAREVLVRQLAEGAPPAQLFLVDLEELKVVGSGRHDGSS